MKHQELSQSLSLVDLSNEGIAPGQGLASAPGQGLASAQGPGLDPAVLGSARWCAPLIVSTKREFLTNVNQFLIQLQQQQQQQEQQQEQEQETTHVSGGNGSGSGDKEGGGSSGGLLREFLTCRCIRDYIMWELQQEVIWARYLEPHPVVTQMHQLQRPESSQGHPTSSSSSSSSSSSTAAGAGAGGASGGGSNGSAAGGSGSVVIGPNTSLSGNLLLTDVATLPYPIQTLIQTFYPPHPNPNPNPNATYQYLA